MPYSVMNLFWILYYLLCILQLTNGSHGCLELFAANAPALLCNNYQGTLPPDIGSKKFSRLSMESAIFPYGSAVLSRPNFTRLESLNFLRITSSGLERIDPDAFIDLKFLTHLDLSNNKLPYIESGTFRGLKLKKLILSGNLGLQLPNSAFEGATIFNFVAQDCGLRTILFKLFEKTKTKHINVANNKIQALSNEFMSIIQPNQETVSGGAYSLKQNWGSVDLTNNSLMCDCNLLWLAHILDRQRKVVEDRILLDDSMLSYEERSSRNARTTPAVGESFGTVDDKAKLMYQMNITCTSPHWLVRKRFPIPSEFDCPAPRITGIDINMLGKTTETVQLTCHATGRPTPNVAWAFKQHNQEVHRIVKSPKRDIETPWGTSISKQKPREEVKGIFIALNVSLTEFQSREFSCITWIDSNMQQFGAAQIPDSDSSATSSSIVPRGSLSPDRSHRVFVRLRGLQLESGLAEMIPTVSKELSSNLSLGSSDALSGKKNVIGVSPYQQLFIKRFTPLDLIGTILGTFAGTLILLCFIMHCIPYCCGRKRHKPPHGKEFLLGHSTCKPSLGYNSKQLLHNNQLGTPFLNGDHQDELTENMPMTSKNDPNSVQTSNFFTGVNTVGSGSSLANAPGLWSVQDYAYSPITSHEYDVPGLLDPLAGAMPIAMAPNSPMNQHAMSQQATGTLLRRNHGMQISSLQPSAAETPQMFNKVSSTALLLPQVASVPPLLATMGSHTAMAFGQSAGNSPFLNYQPNGQQRSHSQLFASQTYFNNPITFGALPNGQMMMTPNFVHTYQPSALYSQHGLANLQPMHQMQQQQQQLSIPNSQQTTPQKHVGPAMVSSMAEFTSEKSEDEANGRFDDESIADVEETDQGKFIGADSYHKDSRLKSSVVPLVNSEY